MYNSMHALISALDGWPHPPTKPHCTDSSGSCANLLLRTFLHCFAFVRPIQMFEPLSSFTLRSISSWVRSVNCLLQVDTASLRHYACLPSSGFFILTMTDPLPLITVPCDVNKPITSEMLYRSSMSCRIYLLITVTQLLRASNQWCVYKSTARPNEACSFLHAVW
jgi:hypothetical protein